MSVTYYIGWDVGAWYCRSHKGKSCDALVLLDKNGEYKSAFRDNLKGTIDDSQNSQELLESFIKKCGEKEMPESFKSVLAMDTPLGFSNSFIDLLSRYKADDKVSDSFRENNYLFRETEKYLSSKKHKPLSAVNNRIGSQATKGIHFISKFTPFISEIGVWKSKNENLTLIETYPSANRQIEIPEALKEANDDIKDAYICAKIAYIFGTDRKVLVDIPTDLEVPEKEGWIWYMEEEKEKV